MTDQSTADRAKTAAKGVADDAQSEAGRLTDEAQSEFKGLVEEASAKAKQQADAQAHRAASSLNDYSEQLREMSSGASADNQAARFVDGAADRLESVASTIENKGWNGLLDDVSRFARSNPTGFLAAAFGVGFAASRIIRNADTDGVMHESDSGDRSGSVRSGSDSRSGYDRNYQAPRASTPVEASSPGYGAARTGGETTESQDTARIGSER